MGLIIAVVVAIFGAALMGALLKYLGKAKCPDCGSRKCLLISRTDKGSCDIDIRKIKNIMASGTSQSPTIMPYRVSNRRYIVPGTRYFFESTYRCTHCGKEFVCSGYKDIAN